MGMAQTQGGLLDIYVARVKSEKRAEFDAVCKKMVDANRRHDGDSWVALETTYGDLNTVIFSSSREDYAAIETGMTAFTGALGRSLGMAEAHSLEQQFNSTLESARTETRARRHDLSYNPPADHAAYVEAIGKTRWIRSVTVYVRPGHSMDFEAALKELKAASQKTNQPGQRWVSQVTNGGSPGTYVLTRLLASWSELDKGASLQELLGEEGYAKFQKTTADAVVSIDYEIFRVAPELSNPPAEIIAVAPDFWNPTPEPTARPGKEQPDAAK